MSDLAASLCTAWTTHEPIRATGLRDLAVGYRVQREFVAHRSSVAAGDGGRLAGYKVALTSPEAQQALGADEPAAGRLLAADVRPSGSQVALDELFAPLLEVELIFRVREALPASATLDDVLAGTEVAAGIECPDGRYVGWFGGDFPALHRADVISDNCLAGLIVVGDTWLPAAELDLPSTTARLFVDGAEVAAGAGTEVLGHPGRAVVWLAAHLGRSGEKLTSGELISSGTFTPPRRAGRESVRAEFSDGLGEVTVTFG